MSAGDGHLRRLVAETVAALAERDYGGAKWSAVFAGGELARMARNGNAVPWPAELENEPLRGWAEYGADLARNAFPGKPAAAWRPRPGGNHAARAVVSD